MKTWIKKIRKMGACSDAVKWGEHFKTLEEAWAKCERGDWMLWFLGKLAGGVGSDSRKKLALVACQCARLSLTNVKKGETGPLKAIEITEAWARGEVGITLKDVRVVAYDAAYAAYDAAYDVVFDAAYDAAHAAGHYDAHAAAHYDAYAAYAAAYVAYAAAHVDAVSYAVHDAAAYVASLTSDATHARLLALKNMANIVREYYPDALGEVLNETDIEVE